jgi:hypothetical protein
MYFGLWSRLRDFEPAALTRALEASDVVQGTLMRVTIHLVSPRDYWPFAAAVRDARRTLWLRAWKEPGADAMAEAARHAPRRAEGRPLPRKEVEALIGKEAARRHPPLARPAARPAVGHLGASPRGSLRPAEAAVPGDPPEPEDAMDHSSAATSRRSAPPPAGTCRASPA